VSSAAAANAVPVAEYTVAAIFLANKRVFPLQRRYAELRAFRFWPEEFPGLGNYRKTVGIVGASRVGRKVIELLSSFDLALQVYDPFLAPNDASDLGVRIAELDELLATSRLCGVPPARVVLERARRRAHPGIPRRSRSSKDLS
jgi:phosphoglycerate dehydrogenase-like enzyme